MTDAPAVRQARGAAPEDPLPLREAADRIAGLLRDLPPRWLEGQVTEVKPRPGAAMGFLTLRDVEQDVSMSVVCPPSLITAPDSPVVVGQRVVAFARPEFWRRRGQLMLRTSEIRAVGIGDLLARLERLRQRLAAEGLFADSRKRALPFLPRTIGLITGRAGDAQHDVLAHVRRRWPAAVVLVAEVAVQGPTAAAEVAAAVTDLGRRDGVDVLVIARGGGSFEDLLPFSDEDLLRTVAACPVPVVSAIGHEADTPLLDLVADRRASTPTDAARLIVPDAAEEATGLARTMTLLRHRVRTLIAAEGRWLADVRSRPVLAEPRGVLVREEGRLADVLSRLRRTTLATIAQEAAAVAGLTGQMRALSPQATLDRGYAVVLTDDSPARVLRAATETRPAALLDVRLGRGRLLAQVVEAHP